MVAGGRAGRELKGVEEVVEETHKGSWRDRRLLSGRDTNAVTWHNLSFIGRSFSGRLSFRPQLLLEKYFHSCYSQAQESVFSIMMTGRYASS